MAVNKGYLTAKTDKASDEYYTPREAVKPIIKYIDRGNKPQYTVWCPFDTRESEYVKCIEEAGHKVIFSHIDNGQNFFEYEPSEHYDYIISNPPFSIKDDILKRLKELGKPFAILLPLFGLETFHHRVLFYQKLYRFQSRLKKHYLYKVKVILLFLLQ